MAANYDWEANKALVTDSTGRKLTIGLFKELADAGPAAPFSLDHWRKVYVEVADPTDYTAAMQLIGNWDHWQALLKCPSFVEHLERWRAEVDAKLAAEAISNLRKQAKSDKGTAAARWLAERGLLRKPRSKTNGEKEVNDRVNSDAKRLGLRAVK